MGQMSTARLLVRGKLVMQLLVKRIFIFMVAVSVLPASSGDRIVNYDVQDSDR